jgi:hypothetical protein
VRGLYRVRVSRVELDLGRVSGRGYGRMWAGCGRRFKRFRVYLGLERVRGLHALARDADAPLLQIGGGGTTGYELGLGLG